MLLFALTVFFLIITPGPGVLSLAGVGSAYGMRAGLVYLLGLLVGTNLVALSVVLGLSALLFSISGVREVLLFASVAYLLYLAFKIAFSHSKIGFIEAHKPPGITGGVLLQIINPKAYAVNTTLFTGFNFLPESLVGEIFLKFLIMNAIWLPLHLLWLYAGVIFHSLNLPPRTQMLINFAMAAAMLAVVALASFSLS